MNIEDKRKYHREYQRKRRLRNSLQERASQKKYRDNNKDKRKNGMLQWRFNLTLEEYNAMSEAQGHVCKLCGNPETSKKSNSEEVRMLSVDHDHNTGKVRGLLCARCNVQLGHYEKAKPRVKEFEKYLKEYE
jgi:peptide methionine sulfoxide reductase MsrB